MTQTLPSSITNVLQPRRRLNCAETAKLIRRALKEAFPEIKFSVRSSTYSMGASIDVGWTDGPLVSQVNPITNVFSGATFDGMQDLKEYKSTTLDGAIVSFGADYVFCQREISQDRLNALEAVIARTPRDMWLTVAAEMDHPSPCAAEQHAHCNARDFAWQLLTNCGGEAFIGRRSALAESVSVVDEARH